VLEDAHAHADAVLAGRVPIVLLHASVTDQRRVQRREIVTCADVDVSEVMHSQSCKSQSSTQQIIPVVDHFNGINDQEMIMFSAVQILKLDGAMSFYSVPLAQLFRSWARATLLTKAYPTGGLTQSAG